MSESKRKNWTVELDKTKRVLLLKFRGEFVSVIPDSSTEIEEQGALEAKTHAEKTLVEALEERGARIPGVKWPKAPKAPKTSAPSPEIVSNVFDVEYYDAIDEDWAFLDRYKEKEGAIEAAKELYTKYNGYCPYRVVEVGSGTQDTIWENGKEVVPATSTEGGQ